MKNDVDNIASLLTIMSSTQQVRMRNAIVNGLIIWWFYWLVVLAERLVVL